MADTNLPSADEQHFNKLFWFCAIFAFIGIIFLMALCFLPVPKSSERFADNVQGFIEGSVVTACLAFLLGGNIPTVKKSGSTIPVTGDNPTLNVTTQPDQPVNLTQ